MNKFISVYEIPGTHNSYCIERMNDIKSWNKLDSIPYDTAVVVLFNDDLRGYDMIVCYEGMMQSTGGSGVLDNPLVIGMVGKGINPRWKSLGPRPYMSDWETFSSAKIWAKIAMCKWSIIQSMHGDDRYIPFFWNLPEYKTQMYGMVCAKLDAIGMGRLSIDSLTADYTPERKLIGYK